MILEKQKKIQKLLHKYTRGGGEITT